MVYICLISLNEYPGYGRFFGAFKGALFGDPNDLALGLLFLIPFIFYGFFRKKSASLKFLDIGIASLFFYIIMLTQSRGGLIGMCGMLLAIWLKSKNKFVSALLMTLVLIISWNFAPQEYKDRMMTISTASSTDNAAISRLDAWTAGFNMMKSKTFGVGLGNFGEGFVRYRPPNAVDVPGLRRASHNMFIQVGGETGFLGLFIFISLIFLSFKTLFKVIKYCKSIPLKKEVVEIQLFANACIVSLFSYCVGGMFLSQAYNWVLYYLIAFTYLLNNFCKNLSLTETLKYEKK